MAENKKTVWIINQYASTPETGMGGRHYYLAKELAKQGHRVYIIAAAYTHLLRRPPVLNQSYKIDQVANFQVVWIKTPKYAGAHSRKRVFNWFYFPWKLIKLKNVIPYNPDTIIYSSPSLIGYLGAERLARQFNSKLIFEVRDIWPLTLSELGGYSPKHPFIRFLQWIEDRAYQHSDLVISNLKYAINHMTNRGMDPEKFTWIPNGFDLEEVNNPTPLCEDISKQIPKNKFIVGYTGTIGMANALDVLLDVAAMLTDNPNIIFVLIGSGREKEALIKKRDSLNLNNVYFIDAIQKESIQNALKLFDICFIGYKESKLYEYGIAANKIPEYLFSGKPVIHAYSGKGDPIREYGAGISIQPENPDVLKDAIVLLYSSSKDILDQMGKNAKQAALSYYEYSALAKKLSSII